MHNYDILANPLYAERYLYTPCRYPNRELYAISPHKDRSLRKTSLDLIRVVCDLPYMSERRARRMDFTIEYLMAERGPLKEEKFTKVNESDMTDNFDATFER